MNALAPMNIFLRQEIDRMQRVITVVRSTLQDLKLAIDGTIIMSEVSSIVLELNIYIYITVSHYYRTSELHWILYMMLKCLHFGRR